MTGLMLFITFGCTMPESPNIPAYIKNLENLTIYPASISTRQPSMDIELIREVSLGNKDSTYFGGIRKIVADERGRIFIADYQRHGIHVFQSNGEYLSFIGGEGSGPGEFRGVSSMRITSNKLYVYDSRMMRITEIDLDSLAHSEVKSIGSLDRESIEKITGFPSMGTGNILTRKDETLLVEFYPMTSPLDPRYESEDKHLKEYYLMNYEGEIVSDRLFTLRNRVFKTTNVDNQRRFNAAHVYEFLGKPLMAVSNDDHIYTAWSEDFLVMIYAPNGRYQRAFYYPHERKKLERREAIQHVKDLGGSDYYLGWVQNIDLPETWPALTYMVVDDENRLWISTITEDYELFDWWVLDDYGHLQATFTWPRNRIIEEVKNGYVYTRIVDGSGDISITRFRIEMEKHAASEGE